MIEKFKFGDKIMGIVDNRVISGTVSTIEHVGINSQYPLYTIVNSKDELVGVLSESKAVRFDAFKWMQIEIFFNEYKKCLIDANNKLIMIMRELYESTSSK